MHGVCGKQMLISSWQGSSVSCSTKGLASDNRLLTFDCAMRLSVRKGNLLRRFWSALSDSLWFISKDMLYDGWRPSLLYGIQLARYFRLRNRNHQIKLKSRETRAPEAQLSICIKPDLSIRLKKCRNIHRGSPRASVFLTTPIKGQIFLSKFTQNAWKPTWVQTDCIGRDRFCFSVWLSSVSALLEYLRFQHICKLELSRKHRQICGTWAVYSC